MSKDRQDSILQAVYAHVVFKFVHQVGKSSGLHMPVPISGMALFSAGFSACHKTVSGIVTRIVLFARHHSVLTMVLSEWYDRWSNNDRIRTRQSSGLHKPGPTCFS